MALTNKDVDQKRERLLAARDECLAQMSDHARRTFGQRAGLRTQPRRQTDGTPPVAECTDDHEMALSNMVAPEVRSLIAEAHRLRKKAESRQDIKTALKGLDMALKAVQLYGVVTGQIRDPRAANVNVNIVATREEGIQTAAELLLALAGPAELVLLIEQLQKRLAELKSLPEPKPALPTAVVEIMQAQLLEAASPEDKEEEIG